METQTRTISRSAEILALPKRANGQNVLRKLGLFPPIRSVPVLYNFIAGWRKSRSRKVELAEAEWA